MRRIGVLNGFDGNNPLFRSYVADARALAPILPGKNTAAPSQ
jgi:hypothetical protein